MKRDNPLYWRSLDQLASTAEFRAFIEDDPAIDPADNPFAALAALKRGPRPN